MEFYFHLAGFLCYTMGFVYYCIALRQLLAKRDKQ